MSRNLLRFEAAGPPNTLRVTSRRVDEKDRTLGGETEHTVEWRDDGIYVRVVVDPVRVTPPASLRLRLPPKVTDSWTVSGMPAGSPSPDMQITVEAIEPAQTLSGEHLGSVRVRIDNPSSGWHVLEWLAPGLGLVRSEVRDASGRLQSAGCVCGSSWPSEAEARKFLTDESPPRP